MWQIERENMKQLNVKGELSEESVAEQDRLCQAFEKTKANASSLGEILQKELPELKEEEVTSPPMAYRLATRAYACRHVCACACLSVCTVWIQGWEQEPKPVEAKQAKPLEPVAAAADDGIFDDDDTRALYETLADMRMQVGCSWLSLDIGWCQSISALRTRPGHICTKTRSQVASGWRAGTEAGAGVSHC